MAETKRKPGRPKKSVSTDAGGGLKGPGVTALPGPGHNGGELDDAAQRALMMDHARKVDAIDQKIEALKADRKSAIGAAKAEGIPAKDIKKFLQIQKMETDEQIREEIEKTIRFTRWNGGGVQTDLIELLKAAPAVETNAYNAGFVVGVEDGQPKFPDYTGAAHEAAMRGYHEGRDAQKRVIEKRKAEEAAAPDPFIAEGAEEPEAA